MTDFFADFALLPHGWERDVRIAVDRSGTIAGVVAGGQAAGATRLPGVVIPGMPNVHSHAFQRALAGRLERAATNEESFWTWRRSIYDFVARLDPEALEAIAAQTYVEMLEAGYTAVGEFHYVHHDRDGVPYAQPTEMSDRLLQAAGDTGIGLTLLPVLYSHSDFGAAAPLPEQRRFVTGTDAYLAAFEHLSRASSKDPQVRVGIAPHSLRAVTVEQLTQVVAAAKRIDPAVPIHLHVAEQQREVEACIAWSGRRPVEWLLANAPLSLHWTLVHATQVDDEEIRGIVRAGATVGLCPSTEANLGDGIFPAKEFADLGGTFAIGSDSHVTIDVAEELRLLEYGQRLSAQRRLILRDSATPSVGEFLYRRAVAGGARSLGRPIGAIDVGRRADLVVLDVEAAPLAAWDPQRLLDVFVFGGRPGLIRSVYVGGHHRVVDGRHVARDAVARRYRDTLARLL